MLAWLREALTDLHRHDLYRTRRRVRYAGGARVWMRGRELVSFASNDYLGLATDLLLRRASARAARLYGCGGSSSPLIAGFSPPLCKLERDLARWEDSEAALVFASGFAANLGTVASLVEEGDTIYSDALNHASLIDGCRMSRARSHVYRHADANHLNDLLRRHRAATGRRLIVSDSVFSMDGDLAPLSDLIDTAWRHDCQLLIDEAHATGVLGERGRGATDLLAPSYRWDSDRFIKIGTLSKALGAQGGFVCGSRRLIEWLVNCARPYIFSTALAPPAAAAARRAVAIVAEEPERRRRLLTLADHLRARLRALGFPETGSGCQIVPVLVGDPAEAVCFSKRLQECGLLVPAIRPPSVPERTARLRISLTAAHTEEDVARLVEALGICWTARRGASHAHG
jgi:8-amino-7-oxononanoate synthase